MNIESIEEILKQLSSNPYTHSIVREQLERYNNRKALALVGRLLLGFAALIIYLVKG